MNKKLLVVALSSVLGATSAFASGDAILNVEGEIQINGQTVIDNQGNLVGLEYAQQNQINIDEYFVPKNGKYTFENKANYRMVANIANEMVTYQYYYKTENDVWEEDGIYQSTDNGDGTYTAVGTYKTGNVDENGDWVWVEETYTETVRETELTEPQSTYMLGSLMTRLMEHEVLESTYPGMEPDKFTYTSVYQYGARLSSHTLDDGTVLSDCIVGVEGNITCKNMGEISWGESEYAMTLVGFEPAAAAQASSTNPLSIKRHLSAKRIFDKLTQK
ncbi:hypothetical protein JCM19239_5913 [Vibrio variabilis]|uniref:Uncharacterized protein n=1 Tax=Vibrio variabilis TaxID=990271 RepID=A0ABQ0J8M8_9VIBR|nr:hypothetical protein JCM19239_5913 [Vibrio variabilis]